MEYSFKPYGLEILYEGDDFSDGPKGRSGHRIAACDQCMYSYGGFNPTLEFEVGDVGLHNLFREIWSYNLITGEWRLFSLDPEIFPAELASISLDKIGTYMLVHGGTGVPFGHRNSNSTYVFGCSSEDSEIKKLETTGQMPRGMYGHGSTIDPESNMLYVVGGTSGASFFMDIHRLDLKTLKWEFLQPSNSSVAPAGRYRHEIAIFDSKLIVFGGGTIEEVFDMEILWAFDLQTLTWNKIYTIGYTRKGITKPKYPMARRCHSGVFVPETDGSDPKYVISGGSNGSRTFNDIWTLNLRTKKWFLWPKRLPQMLYFHDATVTPNGKMIIFGGIESKHRINTEIFAHRTNQVLSCWIKIPKLAELAWEAMLFYAPQLKFSNKQAVLGLGIPHTFAKRLFRSEKNNL